MNLTKNRKCYTNILKKHYNKLSRMCENPNVSLAEMKGYIIDDLDRERLYDKTAKPRFEGLVMRMRSKTKLMELITNSILKATYYNKNKNYKNNY